MADRESETVRCLGEIVGVTTGTFLAHCVPPAHVEFPSFLDPPELGAIVRIGSPAPAPMPPDVDAEPDRDEPDPFAPGALSSMPVLAGGLVFAVVGHARMTTLDSGRRPIALGSGLGPESLARDHPQIFELVVTEFSGLFISHTDSDGKLHRHLPPRPPHLHSEVFACTMDETVAATLDLGFLRRILDGALNEAPVEELCAAVVRCGWVARRRDGDYLADAGRQIGRLLGTDYDRLQRIIRSVI